jgi:hypothetical protein
MPSEGQQLGYQPHHHHYHLLLLLPIAAAMHAAETSY